MIFCNAVCTVEIHASKLVGLALGFTIELERALCPACCMLRALRASRACTASCGRADALMKRMSFINKLDRIRGLPKQLKLDAHALQVVSIGAEDDLEGGVELVDMKALRSKGEATDESDESPAQTRALALEAPAGD